MDINYDNDEITRKCFKHDKPVFNNINVIYNKCNNSIILWNKFQIFVYEDECASKDIVPEFQIKNLITCGNYLMCVDYLGNVHTTSLKFKNAAQKSFKYGFNPRESGIMTCSLLTDDYALCLKYESDAYFLNTYKIATEFHLEKSTIIVCDEPGPQTKEKYILNLIHITKNQIEYVKNVFNFQDINCRSDGNLVVISFDGINVYGCIYNTRIDLEEVSLIKLYTCPSEISNIDFISSEDNLNIIIGLTIGTLVSFDVTNMKPEIIHLNTAIHKLSTFNNNILYTDGLSMWKAENILSKDIIFSQLFVKNVKDFIKLGSMIVCTTYNNIVYTFSINDNKSYIKQLSTDEYCSAENLLNNSEYVQNILEEVKKNEVLVKKQIKERNYITALSLSNRQDIMENIIKQKIVVYENYTDAVLENNDIILTSNFSEYFIKESFYFLIKINTSTDHRLNDVLSSSLGDLRIHIILISGSKVVKTTTVKLKDLKNVTLLIPLQNKYIITTDMRVDVKIITNMPGSFDLNQIIWTMLYRKSTILHSSYFINFNLSNKNICLKEPKELLEDLIVQMAEHQYGTLIEFGDTKQRKILRNWCMYVRLPVQYHEVFKKAVTEKQFPSKKVEYFLHKFTSEDFLKSNCDLCLSIGHEKVKIEIDNDGFSTPSLKVSSNNVKIALDIRNFLSDLIYLCLADFGSGKEFINHSFYITVENIQKALRHYVISRDAEDITQFIEQFEKKVIGVLPI